MTGIPRSEALMRKIYILWLCPERNKPYGSSWDQVFIKVECGPIRFLRKDFKPHSMLPLEKLMEVYLLIRDDMETK